VLHTFQQPEDDPPERRAYYQAAGHCKYESRRNSPDGETVRRHGSKGEAKDQECSGIIQQALAFENRENAMRRPQGPEHCSGRHRVGRGDDRTERNCRWPWHRWYERPGDDGNSGGRKSDRKDDQTGYRHPIVSEVSERRVISRIEQYGRDKERQCKRGGDAEGGHAWKKRQQRTAERQEYRIRCSNAPRRSGQDHRCDEQTKDLF
jgi:hypothetical protein